MFKMYFSLCSIYVFLWTDFCIFSPFLCFESFLPYWTVGTYSRQLQAWPQMTPNSWYSHPCVIFSRVFTRVGLRDPIQYGRSDGMSFHDQLVKDVVIPSWWSILSSSLLWQKPAALSATCWWRRPLLWNPGLQQAASEEPGFPDKSHMNDIRGGSSRPSWAFRWGCDPHRQLDYNLIMRNTDPDHPAKLLSDSRSLGTER